LKLWFLTRSLYPYQKTGGGQIRLGQIEALAELGWDINVIMPNYNENKFNIENNIIQIPFNYSLRVASYLERVGFYEDYFDKWIKVTFQYLKDKINKDDIIFATSGGELGMIKLGSLLKKEIGCKFVANYHDPLDYSFVHGIKLDSKFHISREKQEHKYLSNSNLIITSSQINKESLQNKYPNLKDKIKNNYFGYIKKLEIKTKEKKDSKLRIAYVGNMGTLQQPEILYEVYKNLDEKENIEIYFIGNISSNKILQNIKDVKDKNTIFIDLLSHDEFLEFMSKNIDVGFVSLVNDYLGACVPSKVYEYINLELPIIGALPDGDGKDIINENKYGTACRYNDIDGLSDTIKKFANKTNLENIKLNIQKDKDKWFMKNKIIEVDSMLKDLINEN
jgi:glycosyltransferase involved in cell wall biosynthesis